MMRREMPVPAARSRSTAFVLATQALTLRARHREEADESLERHAPPRRSRPPFVPESA